MNGTASSAQRSPCTNAVEPSASPTAPRIDDIQNHHERDQPVPFGWEFVHWGRTNEGELQRLYFDHQSLCAEWVVDSASVPALPERFRLQATHPESHKDDDGRALPVGSGWTRQLVEGGLSCYVINGGPTSGLRQWWSPAGPRPLLRTKMGIVNLMDLHMPELRRLPLPKMHAWVRVAVEWCHALKLDSFLEDYGDLENDLAIWLCCKYLTEASESAKSPVIGTRYAKFRQRLTQGRFSLPGAPAIYSQVVVSLDGGSQSCSIDKLEQVLQDHHKAGSQHVMVNLQMNAANSRWDDERWYQAYRDIAAVTSVLLLEPTVCCSLLAMLTGSMPSSKTLLLKSSTDIWLLRRIHRGFKDSTSRMRLLLLVQLTGWDRDRTEPIREVPHIAKEGRTLGAELSAFENMCFLVFLNWLRRHWSVHSAEREEAMAHSASTDTENDSGKLWKAIWKSMLDLKVGKLRLEKWYRENYSEFRAELQNDVRFSETAASSNDETSSTNWTRARSKWDPSSHVTAASPVGHRADFEIMMQEALEEAKLYSELLELHNTERALRAANLSIEEAHSVGRITQLAYLFLPLTFVTGVFGMNITAFGGEAPLWKFWITTWLVLLPAWGFGLWTARTQIKESLERRGVIAALRMTSANLRNGPGKMKASLSALGRTRVDGDKENEKSHTTSRVGDGQEA